MLHANQTVFCIVDDAQDAREVLAILTASIGVRAEVYGSVDEYISRFDASRRGCLVLETSTTGSVELIEALVLRGVCLPIVVVIGPGEPPSGALTSLAFDVIQKPFQPPLLIDCMQKALRADAEARVRV